VEELRIAFTRNGLLAIDELLGFIARDNPAAASRLSRRIEKGLERLARFPDSGRKIPEAPHRRERELVLAPSIRIVCRAEGGILWVLHAMRTEQAFHPERLED
jgi:toxin ParE1/3/4